MDKNVNNKKGFTLLETLVAILLLTLSLAPTMLIVSRSLIASNLAREQVTAIYLVQEAIEAVHNLRDRNALCTPLPCSWLNGFPAMGTNFTIDPVNNSAMSVCAGACAPLRYNSTSKLYSYDVASTPTQFTRTLVMNYVPGPAISDEVVIRVTVAYTIGPFTRTFSTEEHLLNWQ